MKKLTISCIIAIVAIAFVSCGKSSMDGDVKKVAELQCKAQKLMQEASSGDASIIEESTNLGIEISELTKEMEGKYTSDAEKAEFGKALLKAMGECQ